MYVCMYQSITGIHVTQGSTASKTNTKLGLQEKEE